MQRPPSKFPLSDILLFLLLALAILQGYALLTQWLHPVKQPQQVAQQEKDKQEKDQAAGPAKNAAIQQPAENQAPDKNAAGRNPAPNAKQPGKAPGKIKPMPPVATRWLTLGSADPKDPYRMLATFSNRGAALVRIELSSPRYHDLDDRGGYLGHLVVEEDAKGDGCPVQVVGAGTPAAKAGLKPGDSIQAVGPTPVRNAAGLGRALAETKPGRTVALHLLRDGKKLELSATLGWRPLEVVRPEVKNPRGVEAGKSAPDAVHPRDNCPPSMLATLQQVGKEQMPEADADLDAELPGVHLRTDNWQVVSAGQRQVVFRYVLPDRELELTKTYRLAKVPEDKLSDADYRGYHLEFELTIKNLAAAGKARKLAYRLDGPNGLPYEGWWFAYTVGRYWFKGAGMRDVIVLARRRRDAADRLPDHHQGRFRRQERQCADVHRRRFAILLRGVDAARRCGREHGTAASHPRGRGGAWPGEADEHVVPHHQPCPRDLQPGASVTDRFVLFAGPKRPDLLAQYKLDNIVYYGWFWWVAKPMLWTLHWFYGGIHNYGLAIILLTVLVRLCMFPLSRKQVLGAQKMQAVAAGDQEDPGEVQEGHGGAEQGPARAVPQAQLQSAQRLPACVHPVADFRRSVSFADGQRRAARRPADFRGGPMVLEPGGARHALQLELDAAGVR